jgi:hypothetical protein
MTKRLIPILLILLLCLFVGCDSLTDFSSTDRALCQQTCLAQNLTLDHTTFGKGPNIICSCGKMIIVNPKQER